MVAQPWWYWLSLLACAATLGDEPDLFGDRVLPPWPPLRAEGREIKVWNRVYTFGEGPVPVVIRSAGAELLTGPASLAIAADGETLGWSAQAPDETGPVRWVRVHEATTARLRVTARTVVEFDGYCRVDLRLDPQPGATLERLVLRVPLRREVARLEAHHVLGSEPVASPRWQLRATPERQWWAGSVGPEGLSFPFTPQVWIGTPERGLAWFADTPAEWSPVDATDAVRLEPGEESSDLVLRFVTAPRSLDRPVKIRFGLMATPVKPWREEVANLRVVHTGADDLDGFVRRFVEPGAWADDEVMSSLRGQVGLAAWVWCEGGGGVHQVLGSTSCQLFYDGERKSLAFELRDDAWGLHRLVAPVDLPPRRWTHLAAGYDGERMRLIVDGVMVAEKPDRFAFLATAQYRFAVGANSYRSRRWYGRLDEVAVFSRAIGPEQARALMDGRLPDDLAAARVANWDFDEPPRDNLLRGSGPGRLALQFRPAEPTDGYQPNWVEGRHGGAVELAGDFAEVTGNVDNLTGFEYLKRQGVDVLLLWNNWSDVWGYPGVVDPAYRKFLHKFLDAAHAAGLKVIPYISIEIVMENEPDYLRVAGQIVPVPAVPFKRGEQIGHHVTKNFAFAEYYSRKIAEFAREFPIDGIYLDGGGLAGTLDTALDETAGPSQARVAGYSTFEGRELMRRIYAVFHGGVRRDGFVLTHNSAPFVAGQDAFTDAHLTGELHYWLLLFRHLTRVDGASSLERWPPPLMQAWFTGQTYGVPMMFCGKHPTKVYTDGRRKLPRGAIVGDDELRAVAALHGLPTLSTCALRWPDGLDGEWWRARDSFGRSGVTWHPCWRNAADLTIRPATVKASFFRREADGALLLVLANLGATPADAVVELGARLGGRAWAVTDISPRLVRADVADREVRAALRPGRAVYLILERREGGAGEEGHLGSGE